MKIYRIFIIKWSRNLQKTLEEYVSINIIRKRVSVVSLKIYLKNGCVAKKCYTIFILIMLLILLFEINIY